MTVEELIEALEEAKQMHGEEWASECQVVVGYQPNWPLEAKTLSGFAETRELEMFHSDNYDEEKESKLPVVPGKFVITTGGSDNGYGKQWWWSVS